MVERMTVPLYTRLLIGVSGRGGGQAEVRDREVASTRSSVHQALILHTLNFRDAKKPESLIFKIGEWGYCAVQALPSNGPVPAVLDDQSVVFRIQMSQILIFPSKPGLGSG